MISRSAFLAALLLAGLVPSGAVAASRYVVAQSAGFGNVPDGAYLSPGAAAFTIGDALLVASGGDTVKVAGRSGSPHLLYRERFTLPAGVVLLGGYDVADPALGTRTPDTTPSEIDGTPLAESDPSGPVITVAPGAGPGTIVEGFRIRGGGPTPRGGGMLVVGASPTVRDNVFFLNAAGSFSGGGGGGIRLEDGSMAVIDGNTFASNTSFGASGTGSGTLHILDSSPIVTNNIIFGDLVGAAILCQGASSPTIRANDHFGNPAGGILGCVSEEIDGNIGLDPLFCDANSGVYTLFDESPVIGAGLGGRTMGALGPDCHARVKYVSKSGNTPRYPYRTPAEAASRLADVLPIVQAGDTVLVATATYTERITVPPGVMIQGDWNNIFTARGFDIEPSVIDGTGSAGPVVTFLADAGVPARLEGFVVTGGRAPQGSAILAISSSPVLRSLSVLLNANAGGSGGVIHADGGSPEIVNTLVAVNAGAGVSCAGSANPNIHHSGFHKNSGGVRAGCPGTLPANVLTSDPLFCRADHCSVTATGVSCGFGQPLTDFRLYFESPYRTGGDTGGLIGILRPSCNRTAHFVSAAGGNVFPYITPSGAATTIATALGIATSNDTIKVAAGIYSEAVTLAPDVRIEGGWNAGFTARDPETHVSEIRADVPGQAAVLALGPQLDGFSVLSGFTITHAPGVDGPGVEIGLGAEPQIIGNVIRDNVTSRDGAGIVMDGGGPNIQDNTIIGNTTTSSFIYRAGGISLRHPDPQGALSVTLNLIYGNHGGYGISCGDIDANDFPFQLANRVTNNLAFAHADAPAGGSADIYGDCGFQGNRIADPLFCDLPGGEITVCFNSPAVVGDVVIGARGIGCICTQHNFYVVENNGRALFPWGTPVSAAALLGDIAPYVKPGDSIFVASGNFELNSDSLRIVNGVTMYGGFDPATFNRNRTGRTTLTSQGDGSVLVIPPGIDSTTVLDGFSISTGRAERGAGIFVSPGSSPILSNIRYNLNVADLGGAALYCAPGSRPKIRRSLFFDHRTPNPLSSVLTVDDASPEISNCTFFNNLTIGIDVRSGAPEIFNNILYRNDRGGIRCAPESDPVVDHNCAFNNDDFNYDCPQSVSPTNLSKDPLFCDAPSGILSLFDHSPAAGTGRDGVDMGAFPVGCVTSRHFVSSLGDSSFYPYNLPETPARRLQDAISVAGKRGLRSLPGLPASDTVFVAGGVYEEDLVIPANVVVLSGFTPNFGIIDTTSRFNPRARDFVTNRVTVRGSGQGSVVTIGGGGTLFPPIPLQVVLEGLHIRGGRAERGGGVFASPSAAAYLRNCTIDSCEATIEGGAVYVGSRANFRLDFVSGRGNAAPRGAALFADSASSNALTVVTNSTFVENTAGPGGGIVEFGALSLLNYFIPTVGLPGFQKNLIAYNDGIGLKIGASTALVNAADFLFWQNAPADTSVPEPMPPSTRIADPKFCDFASGSLDVSYASPAVLARCARLDLLSDRPTFREIIGAYAVGCTDPGHSFLVRQNVNGFYPFACPEAASPRIGDALARAVDGDTVKVAGQPGNIPAAFTERLQMSQKVAMLGGWDGNFVTQNSATNRVVIRGSGIGSILTIESRKDGAGVPIESTLIDTTAVVDGFIFEDGVADLADGGAILCLDASPRITNNRFQDNSTQNFGGGVCALRSKNQRIQGNVFAGNRASHGGGVYLGDCESPILRENLITSNRADLRGAGIRLAQHRGLASIDNNTVASNNGEGISFAAGSSDSRIFNNIIAFNTRTGMQRFPTTGTDPIPEQFHNLYWANFTGNYQGTEAAAGDVFLDPLFCSRPAGDYRLQACSPAIGRGAPGEDSVIGAATATGPFCADSTAPGVTIAFLKNSIAPRYMDVYVSFSEIVNDTTLRVFQICRNQAPLPLTVTREDTTGSLYGTQGIETSGCGELELIVSVSDACGNDTSASRTVSTAVVEPGGSDTLTSADGNATLGVWASRAGGPVLLLLSADPPVPAGAAEDSALAALGTPVGSAYEFIGPSSLPGSDVSIAIRGPAAAAKSPQGRLALYRREGTGWSLHDAEPTPDGGGLSARVDRDGIFRLVLTPGLDPESPPPARFALHQNAPNPARGATSIAYDLPQAGHATLRILDVSGRAVATLLDRSLPAGRHASVWTGVDGEGRRVPSGIYFYELSAAGATETRKLVFVR